MQNVVQKLDFGSDNYMVGSSPLVFMFRTPISPNWSTIDPQTLTLTGILDTYDDTTRTDYDQVFKELIGGRPVVINLSNNNSDPHYFRAVFTSHPFKSGAVVFIPLGTVSIPITDTTPMVTHYITGMIVVTSDGVNAHMIVNP